MTETTDPMAKVHGVGVREALAAFKEVDTRASEEFNERIDKINKPLNDAHNAIDDLLGYHTDAAFALRTMANELSRDRRKWLEKEASEAYEREIKGARERRDAVLKEDPFIDHLYTVVRRRRDYHVDAIMAALPMTMAQIVDFAEGQDWCEDFESIMRNVTRGGHVDTGTTEIVRPVTYSSVPVNEDGSVRALHGEKWEAVIPKPNYLREHRFSTWEMIRHVGQDNVTFRRVPKKDTPKED